MGNTCSHAPDALWHFAYLKTHRAIVICVKCIEQEMCVRWSIYKEKKHTHKIKKNTRPDSQSAAAATPPANKTMVQKEGYFVLLSSFKEEMLAGMIFLLSW